MLSYELAKELRDNGFTQGSISGIYTNCDYKNGGLFHEHEAFSCESNNPCNFCKHILEKKCTAVYVPTLSELIEACGGNYGNSYDKFILWYTGEQWAAGQMQFCGNSYVDDYPYIKEYGKSPEEAVANLWLKLNKK